MKHDYSISTLQARTFLDMIDKDNTELTNREIINHIADSIITNALCEYPRIFRTNEKGVYFAFVLSQVAKKAFRQKSINVADYISMLASEKLDNSIDRNDKGAFGDLLEILIRIYSLGKLSLVQYKHLSVSKVFEVDLISKRYGKVEIGSNGKTFCEGTALDFMAGKFESIIYGVFSDMDKNAIYSACIEYRVNDALDLIAQNCGFWRDKYEFLNAMQTLTRGVGITIKSGKVMLQYNTGKHKAFLDALRNGVFEHI